MNKGERPFYIRNLAIGASAGSGKTYQLAMRYILLLLSGAEPDQIAAITFSRKAASEIFHKIITQLIGLLEDSGTLQSAKDDGFFPEDTTSDDLTAVLRKLLVCRKKLHIETNDSFLMQIVQGAPAEFGISGEISMIDEEDDRPRQRAFLQTLHTYFAGETAADQEHRMQELYYVLRDLSFGKQNVSLYAAIVSLLEHYYPVYLDLPDPGQWSLPDQDPRLQHMLTEEELDNSRTQFDSLFNSPGYDDLHDGTRLRKKLNSLFDDAAAAGTAGHPLRPAGKSLSSFLENRGGNILKETESTFHFFYYKEYQIDKDLADILRTQVRHILSAEYLALQKKNQAVFTLMKQLDNSYIGLTRKAGKLTFADILYLVNRKSSADYGAMQILEERLALRINHYLLDEFQDTSDAQWNAFKDLILEVIQAPEDPDRLTSFFMVGDPKQSIYQWREGNPKLFREICREQGFLPYRPDLPKDCHGVVKGLSKSYRSTTPVLELVNRIFATEKNAVSFPVRLQNAAGIWLEQRENMGFVPHVSGLKPDQGKDTGCAMVLETSAEKIQVFQQICGLIRKLDPFGPGRKLSVGILFSRNDDIIACYEAMKSFAPELNVSMEGKLYLRQSMGYAVFRQFLRYAVHPGDETAPHYFSLLRSEHADGTSDSIRDRLYPGSEETLPQLIRREIRYSGYTAFFRHFRTAYPETEKESEYMDLLENLLLRLEREKEYSADELLSVLDRESGQRSSLENTVELMTVHKSKGLEFDVLIYPVFPAKKGNTEGAKFQRTEDLAYFAPGKDLLSGFPAAEENEKEAEKNRCYESWCNLYVALTRAARGLYVLIPAEKESSAATMYHSDIIRAVLPSQQSGSGDGDPASLFISGVNQQFPAVENEEKPVLVPLYCCGDPDWIRLLPAAKEKSVRKVIQQEAEFLYELHAGLPSLGSVPVKTKDHKEYFRPSAHAGAAKTRFAPEDAAEQGTRIHEVMKQFAWSGTDQENEEFLQQFGKGLDAESFSLLQNALKDPGIRKVLTHPGISGVRLLREQPFLMKGEGMDAEAVNGIIDRAVIAYSPEGTPVSAEIIDYKTDRLLKAEDYRERYERQLQIYRKAVRNLTGLPEEKVHCTILALRTGLVIRW